ncbi:gliding motility lipoprotein GldH [Lutibacter sp.]|uniref:gliding motility lipoprotein GldH n=1 Tax=Lutibacter sp. TaxID=1925666 RepID=UPI002733D17C|nr:gliding motility lipoprotein GldH [Lutibacter sp.]MDP3312935.1 gliding motility lipoprotein GldH [Lutibacter sp.]
MNRNLILIVSAFVFLSCNSNEVYNMYFPIENHEWHSKNKIEFVFENIDTISKNNIFINIRNTKSYEYSSLFLIAKIEFPSGLTVIDTLEYEMADPSGNWLGSGLTDLKENKLFYKERVMFPEMGNFEISIQHATRGINDIEGVNPLKGISDVGLSIEQLKNE